MYALSKDQKRLGQHWVASGSGCVHAASFLAVKPV